MTAFIPAAQPGSAAAVQTLRRPPPLQGRRLRHMRRKLSQRFLDFFGGIDTGRIMIAEMVDIGRHVESCDIFGRFVQERKA